MLLWRVDQDYYADKRQGRKTETNNEKGTSSKVAVNTFLRFVSWSILPKKCIYLIHKSETKHECLMILFDFLTRETCIATCKSLKL